jgi:secondary thiamine-phosphate synthase enzyme
MRQALETLTIRSRGPGFIDMTAEVARFVAASGIRCGLLTLFCRHTSASLLIQENADPKVLDDLQAFFERTAPQGDPRYTHVEEGPDDMPSHIRAALTGTQIAVPVDAGRMVLGTWQAIYLFEHRVGGRAREIVAHLFGE